MAGSAALGTEKQRKSNLKSTPADEIRTSDQANSSESISKITPKPDPTFVQVAVDDVNVEEAIKSKSIGEKIRRLRLKRSMGLVELGKRTGLSASFLSQLETGRVVPTLRNLSRLALVFEKDMAYFFREPKVNHFRTSRQKDRVRLPIGDKTSAFVVSESMSAIIPDRSLVPCIAEFLPGSGSSMFEPHLFKGQELVYVMEGAIILTTGQERSLLELADVAWIDGMTKRQYRSSEGKPAKALIITCPMNL